MQAFCQLCTISRRQKTELDGIQQSRAQDTIKRCLIVRQRNTIPCFCICCKSYRCKIVAGAYCVLFISLDFRLLFHHRRFCAVIKRICWYNFTIRTFYSHPTYQACFSYFRRTIRTIARHQSRWGLETTNDYLLCLLELVRLLVPPYF